MCNLIFICYITFLLSYRRLGYVMLEIIKYLITREMGLVYVYAWLDMSKGGQYSMCVCGRGGGLCGVRVI